jgi:hypothetical protein
MSEHGAARAQQQQQQQRKKTPTTAFLYGLHEHHNGLAKRFSRVVLCTDGGGDPVRVWVASVWLVGRLTVAILA